MGMANNHPLMLWNPMRIVSGDQETGARKKPGRKPKAATEEKE